MKPIKVTVEIEITPDQFEEWADGDFHLSDRMYEHFISKKIYSTLGLAIYYENIKKQNIQQMQYSDDIKITFTEIND